MSESKENVPHSSRLPVNQRGDPYHADVHDGDETHLLDYVKVLSKRRWTLGTVFLMVVVSATVYAFTQTPIYEARARLLIEVNKPNVVQFQQVLEDRQTSYLDEYYETQYQLLQSRSLVRTTLDELDLWDDAIFLGASESGAFTLTRTIADAIESVASLVGRTTGLASTPLPRPSAWEPDEESFGESRAIDVFLDGFAAGPVRNSYLVDISYRSTFPRLATTIINTHADAYINQNLALHFLTSSNATDWLDERLEEQRRVVEASEVALHR